MTQPVPGVPSVESPREQPLLTHEQSLTAKIGQGSEAKDILDQQIVWLGSQCVAQLYSLIRTARIHDKANAALDQPASAILKIVKTLGQDRPVVLRLQNDFLFLGEMHLKVNTQQLAIFTGLMDVLNEWKIGAISFHHDVDGTELREFACLVAQAPSGTTLDHLIQTMQARGIRHIEVEESKVVMLRRAEHHAHAKGLAKNAYAGAARAFENLVRSVQEGSRPSFKQAKRAIENLVDLMKYDASALLGLATLRCHDEYTHNHSVNVCVLSLALGNRAGYPRTDLADLGLAALFHDSGKSSIPLDVLNKPGEFTEEDWRIMRSHPTEGVLNMIRLRGITNLPGRMAAASFEHHMNFDFSGYPKLSVPWTQSLTGRILTIADCYDAMTSSRVYRRQPMAPEKVLKMMLSKSGQAFDPVLTKLFVNCIGIIPIGSLVLLDTNELAVVLRPNDAPDAPQRPWVKVIADHEGNPIEGPELDLTEIDAAGEYRHSIVTLVDNTEYKFDTSRYFV